LTEVAVENLSISFTRSSMNFTDAARQLEFREPAHRLADLEPEKKECEH